MHLTAWEVVIVETIKLLATSISTARDFAWTLWAVWIHHTFGKATKNGFALG